MTYCSIPDCGKEEHTYGYCKPHYSRLKRYGDPLGGNTPRHIVRRFLEEVVMLYEGDECIAWPFNVCNDGYGRYQSELVHRVVCARAYGPPPTPKHEAAHSCGNGKKACCTKGHLRWATAAENTEDKRRHGTIRFGSTAPTAKLSDDQVRLIRRRKASGELAKEIAADLSVSKSLVTAIVRKELWRHLSD